MTAKIKALALVGAVALGISLVGAFFDGESFFQSYLFSFLFWSDLPLGALPLLMVHELTGGRWGRSTTPALRAMSDTMVWISVLALPILLGLSYIYPWMGPGTGPELASEPKIHAKHLYLNGWTFSARTLFYLACWIVLSRCYDRWAGSVRSDESRSVNSQVKLRNLSAGGLVLLGFVVSFAAIDWQMSVEPTWYSTIYGMVYGIGQTLSSFAFALAVLGCVPGIARERGFLPKPQDKWDLGNILLTLVMVWAYLSFMQYLVIWSGNLPHEVTWYLHRTQGGWQWLVVVLALFQFAAPFALLLFRSSKSRDRQLAWFGAALVATRFVDHYWMLIPGLKPGAISFSWQIITSWLGIGGLWMALFLSRLSRQAPESLKEAQAHA